jgi:hypothetical protein
LTAPVTLDNSNFFYQEGANFLRISLHSLPGDDILKDLPDNGVESPWEGYSTSGGG